MRSQPSSCSRCYFRRDRPEKLPTRHGPRPSLWPRLEHQTLKGGISRLAPCRLASHTSKPPTYPYIKVQCSAVRYSKVPRGLSVLPRAHCIFTASSFHWSLAGDSWPLLRFMIYIRAGRELTRQGISLS